MTNNSTQPDIEPQEPTSEQQPAPKATSSRRSLSKLRRELTDDEVSIPMLLDDIERLDIECQGLSTFREKFHEKDKYAAILDERFKTKKAVELIHGITVGIGGAAIGYGLSIWATHHYPGLFMVIAGIILLVLGAAVKAVKL